MWGTVISLLQTTLSIANQWLTWQVALTQIQARKLAYDLDQQQIAKGQKLQDQINAAKSSDDLLGTQRLLDLAANEAGFGLDIRTAISNAETRSANPDNTGGLLAASGGDVRPSGGIPASPATTSSSSDPAQPVTDPKPVVAIAIPKAPLSATGDASIFGLNYDGSNDKGDISPAGANLTGFFIDPSTGKNYVTHNDTLIGAAMPREVLLSTLLGIDDWRDHSVLEVWKKYGLAVQKAISQLNLMMTIHDFKTGKTATFVPFVDVGPTAATKRILDRTKGLCDLMGSTDNSHVAVWIHRYDLKPLIIRGWLFDEERVG